ncbi:MAG: tRNA guanosine(15) transglycosylase TgtA [Candidatus Methanofastidiosa archaeon]|nr:tRNA guanosine(15) transglycosylase TgtA [Candidatus Methanofastidiosa archaeon]
MFEVKAKDGLGRIGTLKIGKRSVETPALMPVINPGKLTIKPSEMKKEFDTRIIITNSYIINSSEKLKGEALRRGVHSLLDFDGIIVTDSGSFQLMQYQDVEIPNSEIVRFQNDIGVDVATFLDIPTLPDVPYGKAKAELMTTLERAEEARGLREGYLNGTIQGSTHLRLRRMSARRMSDIGFEVHPIGAVVPLLMQYRFRDVAEIVLSVKKELSPAKPVHLFGAGHPMMLSLYVLLGCDLFDSAAYVLYARDNRYMTVNGTKKLEELAYLPCNCPVCRNYTPQELMALKEEERVRLLSMHNLHVTYEEIKNIKEALHEGALWDFVEMRVRAHPKLYFAYKALRRHGDFIGLSDPLVKRTTEFYTGPETRQRPVFHSAAKRAEERLGDVPKVRHPIFGKIAPELLHSYPFNVELDKEPKVNASEWDLVVRIADYQFGKGVGRRLFEGTSISYSKNDRIRTLLLGDKVVATLRARDGLFILADEGQRRLHSILPYPKYRVKVDNEVAEYVVSHGDVFAKFVKDVDKDLYSGEEVLVVDENDNLLGSGWLLLSPHEIPYFKRGIAVKTRRGAK